ncbi:MAG: NHL repeat-containing protein [Desulfomonilaceae bacterium]|nr:NHL repeat-containing protein [Desulfomonilaceae bacterium]
MDRRDFIRSVGAVGVFSLLGMIPLARTGSAARRFSEQSEAQGAASGDVGYRGPFAVAFDSSGNLLVSDPPSYRIVRVDPSNNVTATFGKPGSAPGYLNFPKGVAVDTDDRIYVVDSNNCRVQVFDATGSILRVIGSIGSIGGSFATPQGITIDPTGRLLVADTRNHRVQIFQDFELIAIIGDLGDAKDQFRLPTACVARSDGDILVLDGKHGLIKVFDVDYRFKGDFGGGVGSEPGRLNMPQGMGLDAREHVWIADTGNHRVQEFDRSGKLASVVGKQGSGPLEFLNPTGIVCRDDKIYVADNGNRRIQILTRNNENAP